MLIIKLHQTLSKEDALKTSDNKDLSSDKRIPVIDMCTLHAFTILTEGFTDLGSDAVIMAVIQI